MNSFFDTASPVPYGEAEIRKNSSRLPLETVPEMSELDVTNQRYTFDPVFPSTLPHSRRSHSVQPSPMLITFDSSSLKRRPWTVFYSSDLVSMPLLRFHDTAVLDVWSRFFLLLSLFTLRVFQLQRYTRMNQSNFLAINRSDSCFTSPLTISWNDKQRWKDRNQLIMRVGVSSSVVIRESSAV